MTEPSSGRSTAGGEATASPRAQSQALLWLALACLGWGWSFPAMKAGTAAISERVPGTGVLGAAAAFIGIRFLMATLLYGALTWRRQPGFTAADWRAGLTVGGTFVGGMFLQIVGLRYTLPSTSSFLTALYVVLLPLAEAWLLRRRPSRALWLAVMLALAGLCVLGYDGAHEVGAPGPWPFFGEVLTLLAAVLFTAQILFLDRYGRQADTARMTFVLFAVTAAGGVGVSLALPDAWALFRHAGLVALSGDWTFQWTLATTIVLSSVIPFHLMNLHQPRIRPTSAGVVYCLEPVFATLCSVLLGMEGLRASIFVGGGLILAAILLAGPRRKERV